MFIKPRIFSRISANEWERVLNFVWNHELNKQTKFLTVANEKVGKIDIPVARFCVVSDLIKLSFLFLQTTAPKISEIQLKMKKFYQKTKLSKSLRSTFSRFLSLTVTTFGSSIYGSNSYLLSTARNQTLEIWLWKSG